MQSKLDVEVIETIDEKSKKGGSTRSAGVDDVEPAVNATAETTLTPTVTLIDKNDDEGGIPAPDNPLALTNPIIINGQTRDALNWTLDVTSEQFFEADSIAHSKHVTIAITEMDNAFNFWIGGMMIVAANPEIDPKDLEQIRGRDLMKVMRLGRFFTNSGSEQN